VRVEVARLDKVERRIDFLLIESSVAEPRQRRSAV
jgi:hypothetical protein